MNTIRQALPKERKFDETSSLKAMRTMRFMVKTCSLAARNALLATKTKLGHSERISLALFEPLRSSFEAMRSSWGFRADSSHIARMPTTHLAYSLAYAGGHEST